MNTGLASQSFPSPQKTNGHAIKVPSVNPPARLIHHCVDLSTLPSIDAKFYREDAALSEKYVSYDPQRRAYVDAEPSVILVIRCMDERESDFERTMGLAPGTVNSIPLAGCKIGDLNLALCREVQAKIDKSVKLGKFVLVLFVTHESVEFPTTDSCAAWKQSIDDADVHAMGQVSRFCLDYVDRDDQGNILARHLTAFHIKSVTDTEAKIWCGDNGIQLDPMDYVPRAGRDIFDAFDSDVRRSLTGVSLRQDVFHRFSLLYPFESWRVIGMNRERWRDVIGQLTRLCVQNIEMLRELMSKPHRVKKHGHKARRTLVGRGWEMYDHPEKYFHVSDFLQKDDLLKNIRINATYMIRNGLLKRRCRFGITFNINVLYDRDRPGDRTGSIRHAMDLAYVIKKDLTSLFTHPSRRRAFDAEVVSALNHVGVKWAELPTKVRSHYKQKLLSNLRIYVSVSERATRALELVATIEDLVD